MKEEVRREGEGGRDDGDNQGRRKNRKKIKEADEEEIE